jgi:hypothetical protein
LLASREYKSGSRWALFRWTRTDSGYLTRLHLVKTPWFAVCLHWLNEPDPEPYLHDHPVSFLSLILRGEYTEIRYRGKGREYKRNRWSNLVRASENDRHTIVEVAPRTVTLAFMGPKTREWGYHTPSGWCHWKKYVDALRAGEKI